MGGSLIIDLDNTIIGNIVYQLLVHKTCKKVCKTTTVGDYYKEETGLIRAGFTEFINNIRFRLPDVKIFIYTASEKNWAMKEIKWIEKNCRIKFDRPIFTREDCIEIDGTYYKSVKKIYKRLRTSSDKILIIDNSDIFVDNKDSFIKCPNYNYTVFVDIWQHISKQALNDKDCVNWIQKLAKQGYMNPHPSPHMYQISMFKCIQYHTWFAKKLSTILKNNKRYAQDTWWIHLNNIVLTYNLNNIHDIKKYLAKEKHIRN